MQSEVILAEEQKEQRTTKAEGLASAKNNKSAALLKQEINRRKSLERASEQRQNMN